MNNIEGGIDLKQELGIASILTGLTQLGVQTDIDKLADWLAIEVSRDHNFVIAPFLWSFVANGLVNHKLFNRAAEVINFDNLTIYDRTLLYQAEHDIIGSPFSLE